MQDGVTKARQRSIRSKQHKKDCERVAQEILGKFKLGNSDIYKFMYIRKIKKLEFQYEKDIYLCSINERMPDIPSTIGIIFKIH